MINDESTRRVTFQILSGKEYNAEVDCTVSIKQLKKLLINLSEKVTKNCFRLFYEGSDITELEDKKLVDLVPFETQIKLSVITSSKSSKNTLKKSKSKSEKKIKYMLECISHTNENAHFYCFVCKESLCTICSEKHKNHEIIEKYDYSRPSEEIMNKVLDEVIKEVENLERKVETMNKEDDTLTDFNENIVSIKEMYTQIVNSLNQNAREKSISKVTKFKDEFCNFKNTCLISLTETKTKKNTDVIVLEDEYFQEIHKTVKNLNNNKLMLIDYISELSKDIMSDYGNNEDIKEFTKEINNDIKNIMDKLRKKTDYIIKKNASAMVEQSFMSDASTYCSNSFCQFILKRRVGKPEMIVYNFSKKLFEKKQILNCDNFLPFSVYINVDSNLYISGGKKNEECVSEFSFYNSEKNGIVKLQNMISPRCSHSMIYFPQVSHLYAVAGYANKTAERFSVNENKWIQIANINFEEKQVPTLYCLNFRYIICMFGYINGYEESEDYFERLDTYDEKALNPNNFWELIKVNNTNKNIINLKIFNVGLVKLNERELLICGGEDYTNSELDKVYVMSINDFRVREFNSKLPLPCSFLDKTFVSFNANQCSQFEFKKNNIIVYNYNKNLFSVRLYKDNDSTMQSSTSSYKKVCKY